MAQWREHSPSSAVAQAGPNVTFELSLLLVLVLAPRVFLRVSSFPLSAKNQRSKFQFDLETVDKKGHLMGCPLLDNYHHRYYH